MADVLNHDVVIIGIKDLKFKVGATVTDIMGAKSLTIDLKGATQKPEGDDSTIAYAAQKRDAEVTVTQAVLSLTAKAALLGDTVVETGVTPNVIATLDVHEGLCPSGILTGQGTLIKNPTGATGTKPADVHFVIPVFTCDPNKVKEDFKIGDAIVVDFGGVAIPDASGHIYSILEHETLTAIT